MLAADFYRELKAHGINFFTGVPDSLLAGLCAVINTAENSEHHIVAANEGNALALAAGHFLATGKPGLVYMQNSGLGNMVNPLLSLMDEAVYGLPALILIGWRGAPGVKDEPQHVKQGQVTLPLLETMGLAYEVLPTDDDGIKQSLAKAFAYMSEKNLPFALVVPKGTFTGTAKPATEACDGMSREDAIKQIAAKFDAEGLIVSTTGMISRELFEYRAATGGDHARDFLTVGSMGHSSSIALGLALSTPKQVLCMEGDGAVLMHMGAMAVSGGAHGPANFHHIVLNNGAHDSVGGLPTVAEKIDFGAVAKACGYKVLGTVDNPADLVKALDGLKNGPTFLEVKVKCGARADLGRPTRTPKMNLADLRDFI